MEATQDVACLGGHYKVQNPGSGKSVTKYYFAGTSRIAMRKTVTPQSDTLTYLLGDHASTLLSTSLGSTSLAVDANEVKTEQALCHSQR